MSTMSTSSRRFLTVIAVAASLLIGFGAIRASAAWTEAAAPLPAAPVSVETLQGRLADESTRSADLLDQLRSLTGHADELSAALAAAQTRIADDDAHAAQLAKDLAAARKKLASLEESIKKASQARLVSQTVTTRSTSAGSSHDDGDTEHDDD